MRPALIKKKGEELDLLRRKASELFKNLHISKENIAKDAIEAYITLWQVQRKARYDLFKIKIEDIEFPFDWKKQLSDANDPNKEAIKIITKFVKAGYANLHL